VGISLPHTDALVLTLAIANHKIHQILIDTGSSADILYRSAFEFMKIDQRNIVSVGHSMVGFFIKQVFQVRSIKILIMARTFPRQKTIMVKFLVINRPSTYNTILGRVTLSELKAVTSTPHLSMKFPTDEGIGVEKGH